MKTTILETRFFAFALACVPCAALMAGHGAHAANARAAPSAARPLVVNALAWLPEQKVTASDGAMNSYFGSAIAIDGSTAVIGADGDNSFQGAAYVFTSRDNLWSEEQKITADDGAGGEQFGYRAVIAGDMLAVSAYSATVNGNTAQGAAYVFVNSHGWTQAQKLTADDGSLFDDFGSSMTLDATTLIIGANGATVAGIPAQGAAYVYTGSAGSWTQQQKLIADDGTDYDNFGISAALKGSTVFIGSPLAPIDGNNGVGAVYVYTESGGTWTQTQKLVASDGATNDSFGMSVAFDGTTAIIGATNHAGTGAAYVFTQSGGTWTEVQKLVSDDGAAGDSFGNDIAMSGANALIGSDISTVDGDTSRGAAYLFTASAGNWTQTHKFIASDGTVDDFFGAVVALEGNTAAIGTVHPTIGGNTWQGAAYFFVDDTIFADGFDTATP